ncbi:unnamed protein product [Dovyalis caffra]|uniref:Clathrin light chain n=1 Tax=Dovyalis caffra TaxID=77055 RepID=A0AAV1SHR6_9ROSI|nr:unnamed protein product [Dovyalis caffra]
MAAFDAFEEIQPSNHRSFDEVDEESYSNFGSYSTAAAPGEFSGGDVSVDHASGSPDVFGFGSEADPSYSNQSPFGSVHVENGNGNGYNGVDDSVFVSDGPILPPPTEMEPEEGFALREWRRQLFDPDVWNFFGAYLSGFGDSLMEWKDDVRMERNLSLFFIVCRICLIPGATASGAKAEAAPPAKDAPVKGSSDSPKEDVAAASAQPAAEPEPKPAT